MNLFKARRQRSQPMLGYLARIGSVMMVTEK